LLGRWYAITSPSSPLPSVCATTLVASALSMRKSVEGTVAPSPVVPKSWPFRTEGQAREVVAEISDLHARPGG
jgi:hypothetical protein